MNAPATSAPAPSVPASQPGELAALLKRQHLANARRGHGELIERAGRERAPPCTTTTWPRPSSTVSSSAAASSPGKDHRCARAMWRESTMNADRPLQNPVEPATSTFPAHTGP